MSESLVVVCIWALALWLGYRVLYALGSAYNNGVTDGYGYSREPKNPGYARAGKYLRKSMSHRWPELKQGRSDGRLRTRHEDVNGGSR